MTCGEELLAELARDGYDPVMLADLKTFFDAGLAPINSNMSCEVDEVDVGLEWHSLGVGRVWLGFFPTKPGQVIGIVSPEKHGVAARWLPVVGPEMESFLGHAIVKEILRTSVDRWSSNSPAHPAA
jgi:hypothetical protein